MNPLPKTMVPPGQRRPGVYLGGIIQIMVTRACDEACNHCTQGSNLAGRPAMMTVEQFEEAVVSLDHYFGVVGVFGGNPALHPKFAEMCAILRRHVPFERRGLWCNNLRGKGAIARVTFYPRHSNLNVHMDRAAHAEFLRDWPESAPYLKGLDRDSLHVSPWVSPTDLGVAEEERWRMIGRCDINRYWSALIGVVRGELRAFFCEIAYAQAALHEGNPDWAGSGGPMPDTGLPVLPGWWRLPMEAFRAQVETHCHHCGIPLRRPGLDALGAGNQEVTGTHLWLAGTKRPDQEFVTIGGMKDPTTRPATQYLPGTTPGYRDR
jgi:hypothetical protein